MVMKKKITILLWLLGVLMACVRETGIPVGENSFAKEAYRPEITLSAIDSITCYGATVRVNLKSAGGRKVVGGVCYYSLDSLVRLEYRDSIPMTLQGNSVYIAKLVGLIPGEDYHCRVSVKNEEWESCSEKFVFTTKNNANSEIKFYTGAKFQAYDYVDFYAQVSGSFDSIGFVYGKDPYLRRNSSYSEEIEKFQENHQYGIYITDYELNTTYYCRFFVFKGEEVYYSSVLSAKTAKMVLAEISTSPVTNVSSSSVKTGFMLLSRSSSKIKRLGFCLGTSLHPTVERGEESDRVIEETIMDYNQIELTGLLPRTTYYLRAFVENASGIAYGEEYSFTTKAPGDKVNEPWKKVTGLPERVSEDAILVRAGENLFLADSWQNLWKYNLSTLSWKKCADLPELKHERLALTSVDSVLYCNYNSQENNYGLACYNIARDEWMSLIDSLDFCDFRGGVLCDGKIYYMLESRPGLIAYDVQQGKYEILGSSHVFPWPYYIFSVDSGIYVGRGTGIRQYSLSSGVWRSRTDAPYAGSLPYLFQKDGYLYRCGGMFAYRTSAQGYLPILLRYDAVGDNWQRKADCPVENVGFINMYSGGDAIIDDGYVVCEECVWQYFPEEDIDCQLITVD